MDIRIKKTKKQIKIIYALTEKELKNIAPEIIGEIIKQYIVKGLVNKSA